MLAVLLRNEPLRLVNQEPETNPWQIEARSGYRCNS